LGIILINLGAEPFDIAHGDRIAQIVFAPVTQANWDIHDDLDETIRGVGGFGSTGRS
jgi:dUTP pyrophosphatase